MGERTYIAWATSTGSPWYGCSKVSPGCKNCYAEELTLRHGWAEWGDDAPRVRSKGFWAMARKLNAKAEDQVTMSELLRPRMFPSLMDWLDPRAPVELLAEFLLLVFETQNLDWLLLSKRIELLRERVDAVARLWACDGSYRKTPEARCYHDMICWWRAGNPPPNIWLGVSVEDQRRADDRIPELLKTPAKVRFLSVEPLLQKVDLRFNALATGDPTLCRPRHSLDWTIIGGESGKNRRDCGVEAIVDIVHQCKAAGVPCFVKQDCAAKPGQQGRIPDDVWAVKEFPVL